MAGVGFSLKKLRDDDSYTGLIRLYGAAGIISSGPWLLSILTLLFIGLIGRQLVPNTEALQRFQVSVTWLFAASLLWTGPLQLMFTRFIADRDYLGEFDETLPNLFGALAVVGAATFALALPFVMQFDDSSWTFKWLLASAFVVLSQTWMAIIVLTGLRAHMHVFGCFALGYGVTFLGCMAGAPFGETGLLAGFLAGQTALLFSALAVLTMKMPAKSAVAFRFLERRSLFVELGVVGLLYNLGVWIDKLIFWWSPGTGHRVLGPLYASEVYDLPIFLAYLTIVPGMAVFLVRVETDFAEAHHAFYAAVRNGAPLLRLEKLCGEMTDAARRAVIDIVKVQGITLAVCATLGPWMLSVAGISELHLPLFYIDAAGVALQVITLAVTSMFFYLDRRRAVSWLTFMLFVTNALLTWVTQRMGPEFYGYGFAIAMALTSLAGLVALSRTFQHLVRDTFMRQPVVS
ncbi:MAG TPA: exopolysaccharide Pel transporter PelG [Polyangiales bacterium]|nr:exopolysaccharide Pel transporter PelG [Polyangiales bacterium]